MSDVNVMRLPARGMITLRGDHAAAEVKAAATGATGLECPGQRQVRLSGETGLAWMSPDEVLVMLPTAEVADAERKMEAALAGAFATVAVVTDARAIFAIEGARAREVLAKLAPVDLSREAFGEGQIRRTRLAQVAAAFWMSGPERFELVCFRSVADYMEELLKLSAAPGTVPEVF
ncbi:MAG: sarcosine oxidase subunit gamma family protein [Pseudomonadota bacterium]